MRPLRHRNTARPGTGLARALSKLGICSRSQGWELIAAGHVTVNGVARRDPEWRVDLERDHFEVNGKAVRPPAKVYLMLNKPRGLVTTASDEQGRPTVFDCLAEANLPFVAPVGRLDKASEGLLLLTNDTAWAAQLTDPESHLEKVYHVQLDCVADETLADRLMQGVRSEGEFLSAKRASVLRQAKSTSWLEIVLDEGKNRHIRRLLAALGVNVVRLIRVAIGELPLGNLPKGKFRRLTETEVRALNAGAGTRPT
jgi:23S rRNA pseudouridine2605 synthase